MFPHFNPDDIGKTAPRGGIEGAPEGYAERQRQQQLNDAKERRREASQRRANRRKVEAEQKAEAEAKDKEPKNNRSSAADKPSGEGRPKAEGTERKAGKLAGLRRLGRAGGVVGLAPDTSSGLDALGTGLGEGIAAAVNTDGSIGERAAAGLRQFGGAADRVIDERGGLIRDGRDILGSYLDYVMGKRGGAGGGVELTDAAAADLSRLDRPAGRAESGGGIEQATPGEQVPPQIKQKDLPENEAIANKKVYFKGNRFSDKPFDGAQEYIPGKSDAGRAGGGSTVVPAIDNVEQINAGTESLRDLRRARVNAIDGRALDAELPGDRRRRGDTRREFENAATRQRNIESFEAAERRRSQAFNELRRIARGGAGVSARMQREAATALARDSLLSGQGLGIEANPETRSQEQQRLAQARKDNALADSQGIQNEQSGRLQDIMAELAQLGPDATPEQRQSLFDKALVAQGKDPRKDRFISIDRIFQDENNPLAEPFKYSGAYDTQTGQFIGGQGIDGAGSRQPAMTFEQYKAIAQKDPRFRGLTDEELQRKYEMETGAR